MTELVDGGTCMLYVGGNVLQGKPGRLPNQSSRLSVTTATTTRMTPRRKKRRLVTARRRALMASRRTVDVVFLAARWTAETNASYDSRNVIPTSASSAETITDVCTHTLVLSIHNRHLCFVSAVIKLTRTTNRGALWPLSF